MKTKLDYVTYVKNVLLGKKIKPNCEATAVPVSILALVPPAVEIILHIKDKDIWGELLSLADFLHPQS